MSPPSNDALFRYQIVSQVIARIYAGERRVDAVAAVAALAHPLLDGSMRQVSVRSVYRWLEAYEEGKVAALERRQRDRQAATVLPEKLLGFLANQKELDPDASIPELIRRARELGIVPADAAIDRSTVYRSCVRLGIPVRRRKGAKERDARRFRYPHRMDMVLCDGKHFRAGATRSKRVVLFFLDNATRFLLHAVVGTSESAELFLRGFYECILKFGLMSILYLDGGPGFIAGDTLAVVAALNIALIHGEARYPEGHGAIERFNRTSKADVLRGLDGRADVDPSCRALELRLQHYGHQIYNVRPHEALNNATPLERFQADERALRFPESKKALQDRFEISVERRVTNDHTIPIDGIDYEMPRGHAGHKVVLRRAVLTGAIRFVHQGRVIDLHPVNLEANARSKRTRLVEAQTEETRPPLPKSAADLRFERDFGPIVDDEGGFRDPKGDYR